MSQARYVRVEDAEIYPCPCGTASEGADLDAVQALAISTAVGRSDGSRTPLSPELSDRAGLARLQLSQVPPGAGVRGVGREDEPQLEDRARRHARRR